jgi:hypothetical protein
VLVHRTAPEKFTKALWTLVENRLNVLAEAGTRSGPQRVVQALLGNAC